ncbi:hypothetical protein [Moraxella catarrhalis]|uniref:hypothetical protein n=1 Tax=Moraxella catarrhalis TaxID=480 RepID=UPI0007E39AA7|nr:hypothetical protein [Moraxella catarrhalis]
MITTEFGKEAPKAVAEFADKQAFKLIQNLDELNNKILILPLMSIKIPSKRLINGVKVVSTV